MGVSTNAYLWWGYSSDEEGLPDSVLAKALERVDHDDHDAVDTIERLLKGFEGVRLIHHCHSEYPMYGLGIQLACAWRGGPVALDVADLPPVSVDTRERVEAAAKAIGWPVGDAPKTWLASYWG